MNTSFFHITMLYQYYQNHLLLTAPARQLSLKTLLKNDIILKQFL